MKKAALLLVGWLTFFVGHCAAADPGCFFDEYLNPGTIYYVSNPEYPNNYIGAHSCQWNARSDYRIKLNCTLNLPSSYQCYVDHLDVSVSPTAAHRYCGQTQFNLESEGNQMNITLTTYFWSSGGRFLCNLQAIERPINDNCRCGMKNPKRIVGGMETGVNEYPMMAGVVNSARKNLFCGATIISTRYALSAAHCVFNRDLSLLGLLVGDHDWTTGEETNSSRLHKLEKYVIHPFFNQTTLANDISILKTQTFIDYNNEVGPACLPFFHAQDSFIGIIVSILGWGTTEFGGPKSDTLQKADVSVISNYQCRSSFPGLMSSNICTYADQKDACQFDSGGPVLWQNPTSGRIVHLGIISYGRSCADGPAVNTRVGSFLDWIASVTPEVNYCMLE